jgi:hypothetical protein
VASAAMGKPAASNAVAAAPAASENKPVQIRDDQYQRNMKRIQNIIQLDIPVDDKVKQLKRIEIEAERDIGTEEEKVQELKKKL